MRLTIGDLPWDCGKYPPERAVRHLGVNEDGQPVREKFSWAPTELILDIAGNVRRVMLTNGASNRDRNDPYGRHVISKFRKVGGLIYHQCPLTDAHSASWVPKDLQDAPCLPSAYGPQADGSHKGPCKHIQKIEKRRKAVNTEKAAREEAKYKSSSERELDLRKQDSAALLEALERIAGPKEPIIDRGEARPSGRKG